MANPRYVSASERSRALCQGAYRWAIVQHTVPQSPEGNAAVALWEDWAQRWGADMAHRARAIQSCAFNVASCWDLYEGCGAGDRP